MRSNYLILFVLLSVFIGGCKTETPEFLFTKGGLKYKYHDIVADGAEPKIGDVLTVKMKWRTKEDSVFYVSNKATYNNNDVIILNNPKQKGGIEEGLVKLKEGDSVTFYIEPKRFFQEYVNSEVPVFLDGDEEMKIEIRLVRVQTKESYEEDFEIWVRDKELEEFQALEKTLNYWRESGDSIEMKGGLYIVYDAEGSGEKVKFNDIFQLHYSATFTDGEEFYSTYNNGFPDEFQFGQKGQMVEGLQEAISAMEYGQKAKVLIPSEMGFKEYGSAGNIVPPYTPVIYYLEILPKGDLDLFIEK